MTRLRLVLALLLASLPACTKTPESPPAGFHARSARQPIVGGSLDTNPAHDAVVFLEIYDQHGDAYSFCTGTQISHNIVLTAAHCVSDDYGNPVLTPSRYGVYWDTDNNGTPNNPGTPCNLSSSCTKATNVAQVVRHPGYDDDALENDIAYVKLTGSAPASVTPIPYLTAALAAGNLEAGASVEFVGYGLQDYPGMNCDWDCPSGTRFHVSDALDSVCWSSSCGGGNPPGTIGYSGNKGPCSGDSGGPAFLTVGGQQYVAGITSYGDGNCYYDGVSTNVAHFDAWLAPAVGPLAALGAACTSAGQCQSGFCASGVCCNQACTGGCKACSLAAGATANGTCASLSGIPCNDAKPCTEADACQAGVCAGTAKVCPGVAGPCTNAGACNPSTGACTGGNKPDGTSCSDGNGCTLNDTCVAGVCTPSGAVNACPAPSACKGPSTCNSATGACDPFPDLQDGTACDDGNLCTVGDSCQAGACVGGAPKACPAPEACHGPGACSPSTGVCSYGNLPTGTTCDDHNACTTKDVCVAGACLGTATAGACAADACHAAGTCDPTSGACSGAARPDGTGCDDGDAETLDDRCAAGLCTGVPRGADPCYQRPDGAACSDGNGCTLDDLCVAHVCQGTNPKVCAAPDACHQPGQCDWQTGECAYVARPGGTACDDGDPSTLDDRCSLGKCAGEPTTPGPGDADAGDAPVQPQGCGGCGTSGAEQVPALLLAMGALALTRRKGRG